MRFDECDVYERDVRPAPHATPESHRCWPLPRRRPAVAMVWHDLLLAHWPVSVGSLRPLVPAGLEIDTFDGQAWLGIVPFRMTGVGPRGWPAWNWLSSFAELNVRTYVTDGQRPGVWFCSLDAAQPVAVAVARRWYHLPYHRARMTCAAAGADVVFRSRRHGRGAATAEFSGRYGPTGEARVTAAGSLAHWLSARYCLYAADRRGRLYRGEIYHAPWPLQPAWAEIEQNTMTAALGIDLPGAPPLVHFARKVDALAWSLDRVHP